MLLALDLSLRETGYCVFNANAELVTSGVIKTKHTGTNRLKHIRHQVDEIINVYKIKYAVIEDYAYAAKGRVFSIGELGGVIKVLLWDYTILVMKVTPSELKKFVTGKGNAKKELMLLNVYKKFGFDTDNNNIADAYALRRFAFKFADDKWKELTEKVKLNDRNNR